MSLEAVNESNLVAMQRWLEEKKSRRVVTLIGAARARKVDEVWAASGSIDELEHLISGIAGELRSRRKDES